MTTIPTGRPRTVKIVRTNKSEEMEDISSFGKFVGA